MYTIELKEDANSLITVILKLTGNDILLSIEIEIKSKQVKKLETALISSVIELQEQSTVSFLQKCLNNAVIGQTYDLKYIRNLIAYCIRIKN